MLQPAKSLKPQKPQRICAVWVFPSFVIRQCGAKSRIGLTLAPASILQHPAGKKVIMSASSAAWGIDHACIEINAIADIMANQVQSADAIADLIQNNMLDVKILSTLEQYVQQQVDYTGLPVLPWVVFGLLVWGSHVLCSRGGGARSSSTRTMPSPTGTSSNSTS